MSDLAEPTRADLPGLTGARGVAAWLVVLYHIREGLSAAALPDLVAVFAKFYLAVDFFFMLSGFVLWLNYGEALRRGGLSVVPRFLARRIARIWPLHLVILAGAVAFALVLEAAGKGDPLRYPWHELPLHILLMQNWGLTSALAWNDPAWSISCEWAAYLLLPLLAFAVDWRRMPTAILVALIAALALALHVWMASSGAAMLGEDIPRFGLPRALVGFVVGTIVCALWTRFRDTRGAAAIGFALAAVMAAAWRLGVPETLAVLPLFACLLFALARIAADPANPLTSRALVYLGEISYATYLVHFLAYVGFKLLFVADPRAVPLPLLALFLVATLAASAILYHFVELPAQHRLRRLFEGRPSEPRPAAAL